MFKRKISKFKKRPNQVTNFIKFRKIEENNSELNRTEKYLKRIKIILKLSIKIQNKSYLKRR